jgi:hypothetical protein
LDASLDGTRGSCLVLALAVSACASANTPQQNLAYERWEKCRSAYTQLQDVGLDGRISFMFSNDADRRDVLGCLAQADGTGPRLPAPSTTRPPGGP